MTTHKKVSKKKTAILAFILFIPPLLLFIGYSAIGVRYENISQNDTIDALLSYFPAGMRNYTVLVSVAIVLSVLSIIFASRSFKKKLLSLRVMMLMIVLISVFLILFFLTQLF